MKRDIILAGVGGQGILSIAAVIGSAALAQGLYVKQAEVHGMSQRGGDVQSNLRLSTEPIASDLIAQGGADAVVSLEPMEALRYVSWLKPDGVVVSSSVPVVNIPNYPVVEGILAELKARSGTVLLDVDALATECGTPRSANMVLLGAAAGAVGLSREALEEGIRRVFGPKGEAVVAANLKAFAVGCK